MTNEKNYALLCNLIRAYGERDASADFAAQCIREPRKVAAYKTIPFYADAAALLVDTLESMDKKTTPRGQLAAVKKFFADGRRPLYQKIFEQDGYFCALDGYKAIRLKHDLPSLPHVTKEDGEPLNLAKALEGARKDERYTLSVPTIAELKAYIAANSSGAGQSKTVKEYCLDGCTLVNPEFLLAALQALPGATFFKPSSPFSPVYFRSDEGDGMILPVQDRKHEHDAEFAAAYAEEKTAEQKRQQAENLRTMESAAAELTSPARIERAHEIIEFYKADTMTARAAYNAIRDLIALEEQERQEAEEKAAALSRVAAVAAAVHVNEQDNNRAAALLRAFERGDITEDEVKNALLFPVSVTNRFALALPSPVETVQTVAAVLPELLERFGVEYDRLYDARDRVSGFREAVASFDAKSREDAFCELVRAFCEARGDYITSDREEAAFVFALASIDLLKMGLDKTGITHYNRAMGGDRRAGQAVQSRVGSRAYNTA